MNTTLRTLIPLLVVGFGSSAVAGTLNNKDAREYRLHVKAPGSDLAMPINTTTRVEHTCSAFPCVVENEDTGEKVKLTCRDENLIIKDGHMAVSVTDEAPAAAVASAPAEAPAKPEKHAKASKAEKASKISKASKAEKPSKHAAKAKAASHAQHARASKHKKGNAVALAE
jgi:hypothetical protein